MPRIKDKHPTRMGLAFEAGWEASQEQRASGKSQVCATRAGDAAAAKVLNCSVEKVRRLFHPEPDDAAHRNH